MKTYEIQIEGKTHYFKTDADLDTIENAITFVKQGEVSLDKVLIAIRMLGHKATPVTVNPEFVFEV